MSRPTTTSRRRGRHRLSAVVAAVLALSLIAAACGDDDDDAGDDDVSTDETTSEDTGDEGDDAGDEEGGDEEGAADGEMTELSLQLQWFAQSQFAGYYAALEEGFYEDEGLDVEILEGGVDIVPQQVLGSGQAELAIAWVPKALASREEGLDIIDVGQIFQRSGTLQVSWADDEITEPADLEGTVVGNWGFGNEFELLAGIRSAGLDPESDVELVQQNFDMQALINREIDAAQAMIYNEYGILLESEDPDTGELFQPEQFNVIDWNDVGTAMLQDAIWARSDWPAENGETLEAFLTATLRGWIFCRDNFDACVDHVMAAGPALDRLHQEYMLNEINALIWPSPGGIGMVDEDLWAQTIEVSLDTELLAEDPGAEAYDDSYVAAAIEALEADGVDVTGEGFEKLDIDLSAAGGG
ncbi:MAG: ABC transporter substrate-binding protein [Actinomycetota bacterium]|nr:ABC transporter substrate-binding protein [Actinomycetota bacterium]